MKFILVVVAAFALCGCQSNLLNREKSNANISMNRGSANSTDECCAHRTADGKCAHELIPGCSTSGIENAEAPKCCAHWQADGTCAHELIPGCSTKGFTN